MAGHALGDGTRPLPGGLADAAVRWALPTVLLTPVVMLLMLVVLPNSFFTFSVAALVVQVAVIALHGAVIALCVAARKVGRSLEPDRGLLALRRWHTALAVVTLAGLATVLVHFTVVEHISVAIPVAALELGGPTLTLVGMHRALRAARRSDGA